MIKVKIKDNLITMSGHADYSNTNDIVCASASSIMYTTVNAILRFDSKAIEYKDDSKKVTIKNLKHDDITNKLIINMIALLRNLEFKYPKNIKIDEED